MKQQEKGLGPAPRGLWQPVFTFVTNDELHTTTARAVEAARQEERAAMLDFITTIIGPASVEVTRFEVTINRLLHDLTHMPYSRLPDALQVYKHDIPRRVGEMLAISARPGGEYLGLGEFVGAYGTLLTGILAATEGLDRGVQLRAVLAGIAGPDLETRLEAARRRVQHPGPPGPREATALIFRVYESIRIEGRSLTWSEYADRVHDALRAVHTPEAREALHQIEDWRPYDQRGQRLRKLVQREKKRIWPGQNKF